MQSFETLLSKRHKRYLQNAYKMIMKTILLIKHAINEVH